MSRKDAKGAKTQRRIRFRLCVFAPFASLRETILLRSKPRCVISNSFEGGRAAARDR